MFPLFGRDKKQNRKDHEPQTPDEPTVRWAVLDLPQTEAVQQFLAVGAPGSGKTTVLRLLMQSVLPRIGQGSGQRALLYDAKGDLLPILSSFCDRSRIKTTHPFDDRGVAWDLARDIREPRVALEIAFTLIPPDQESQPFFSNAARHLMYGVMKSYLLSKLEWSFADLLRGLREPRRLRTILDRHPETRHINGLYLKNKRLLSDIISTIGSKTLAFEPIAAAWEYAKGKFSIEQWITDESILVLGNSETSRTAIDAINRAIVKRASDLCLQQFDTKNPKTWVVLDELSEAGKLDGLVALLKKGRSKGVSLALGFQSINGLRDSRLYGTYATDDILGQVGNRFFGRIECPDTAEWASRLIGDQEISQYTTSTSKTSGGSGGGTSTTSVNQQIVTRRAIMPSQFLSIPPCNYVDGLTGYCTVRLANPFSFEIPAEEIFDRQLLPMAEDVPEFVPRAIDAQYLRPWTREQAIQFGAIPRKRKPQAEQDLKARPQVDVLDQLRDL